MNTPDRYASMGQINDHFRIFTHPNGMVIMRMPFFCTLSVFLLCSCNKRTESPDYRMYRDSLEVGMTCGEVEKLLGKPFLVSNGYTEWMVDTNAVKELSSDKLQYGRALMDSTSDVRCKPWHKITVRGEEKYVRWDYAPKIDSVYSFDYLYDTTVSQVRSGKKYYVKGSLRKVFVEVDSAEYARYAIGDLYGYGDTIVNITEKKTVPRYTALLHRYIKGVSRRYIKYLKCHGILFDASSGMLVAQGEYPIETVR
jgi:hypothetical protein